MRKPDLDAIFSGVIGQDYEMLKLICPAAAEMSHLVGQKIAGFQKDLTGHVLQILELGGGTGITTLAVLTARDDIQITSVDNEPVMQNQAKKNLAKWIEEGKLIFSDKDALTALESLPDQSFEIVASAYTLHNFLDDYRTKVIKEIFRVLKPGGLLVNGDRYGLDDISEHTRLIQLEVSGYFDVLTKIERYDLLEHWIVHLFNDESENHVMRETVAINALQEAGFDDICLSDRDGVNALLTAKRRF